jgi:phosphoribosylformylglycinamidine (FGAM) synthase-like amidotransferase family enzyme
MCLLKLIINKTTYFKNIDNEVLEFHIAHNEGNYFCTKEQLKEIEITSKLQLIIAMKKVKLKNSLILMDLLKILQEFLIKKKMFWE